MTIILSNHDQQLTIKLHYGAANSDLYITAVYAKCTPKERRELWNSLELTNLHVNGPWCIGGDFNVILDSDKKKGGRPHRMNKSLEFSNCMDNCGMMDLGFVGPKYTWCNNWDPRRRIWKRLDRVFINDDWSRIFQNNIVNHLARIGSDHRPILIQCKDSNQEGPKYFKFLNFWTNQPTFLQVVEEVWRNHVNGNPLWRLHQKLKMLSRRLTQWSRRHWQCF
ncbi:uncharacterized protein LOC107806332 [Nicotiana tabacum]|uniref:Uncharacterized protein LOC107806332 n=1 Tax=Nicotiana tabacum TaxID=4097 RepID=A0A1S4BAP1_TOBAC|nr:PREDICTED: uncharacterized protein LOC107806332 [Nicotiana tabacum]